MRLRTPVLVEPGMTFIAVSPRGAFRTPPMIWAVQEVRNATDGRLHAVLTNTADRTSRKTLSADALRDPSLYRAITG